MSNQTKDSTKSSPNRFKNIIIVLVILAVVAGGIVYYFLSSKKTETAEMNQIEQNKKTEVVTESPEPEKTKDPNTPKCLDYDGSGHIVADSIVASGMMYGHSSLDKYGSECFADKATKKIDYLKDTSYLFGFVPDPTLKSEDIKVSQDGDNTVKTFKCYSFGGQRLERDSVNEEKTALSDATWFWKQNREGKAGESSLDGGDQVGNCSVIYNTSTGVVVDIVSVPFFEDKLKHDLGLE